MRWIGAHLFFAVSFASLCFADVTKLPAEDRKVLQDASHFEEIRSIRNLPPAIVALCAGDEGRMADPGQTWNATDSIVNPSLPGKRLMWAATGAGYCVVHYERGGIAHTYHILVAKIANAATKPKLVWTAMGGPFNDYAAFVAALRSGKLDDRLDYWR